MAKIDDDGIERIDLSAENLFQEETKVPPTPQTIVAEAKKTEATIDKSTKAVAKHVKDLSRIDEILSAKAADFKLPPLPSFTEIENHEEFSQVVGELLDIVGRYRAGEVDSASYSSDILRMSSLLVYLSSKIALFQGFALDRERVIKLGESKFYIEAKKAGHIEEISISDTTAQAMARNHMATMSLEQSNLDLIGRYILNIYYSTKAFVEHLDSAAKREYAANKYLPGS